MTREEAINHIKTVAKSAVDSGYDSAVVDAVGMAIEVLEQEPCGKDINVPTTDAISRQAVLEWCGDINMDVYTNEIKEFILSLPSVQPKTGHCKDCKYFEHDSAVKVGGAPLIVAHEICSRWGNGCKTREEGYCFLFEPQESEGKTWQD